MARADAKEGEHPVKLRTTVHPAVSIPPHRRPPDGMLVRFHPVDGGYMEAEVPDEVGEFLLSVRRDAREYELVPSPQKAAIVPAAPEGDEEISTDEAPVDESDEETPTDEASEEAVGDEPPSEASPRRRRRRRGR